MRRKRIGVLTAQADEYTQSRFLSGLFERSAQLGYDVCVFSMYLKCQDTSDRGIGESNIFNLVEFGAYDAVIIFTDRIKTPGTAEGLLWRLKQEYEGPVLVVEDYVDGYDSVNIDHRENICKLTDHLIDVHGYKDIVLLNGWENNINSEMKKKGFLDSLGKHGMECRDSDIYYGNNWYDSGREMADELLDDREKMPDAVVCASDYMALGLAAELERRGVKVPEDIALVGYDTTDLNDERAIPLTSVDIPARQDGIYVADWVDAKLSGIDPKPYKCRARIHWGKSCGCKKCMDSAAVDQAYSSKDSVRVWNIDSQMGAYDTYYNHLMEDLLSQTDYRGFFNTVFQYTHPDGSLRNFSICMNEYWNAPEVMMGANALRVGYTKNIYRIIKYGGSDRNNAIDFDECFDVSKLLPELDNDRNEPEAYIFTPLNFNDRCFGYAAISGGDAFESYSGLYRDMLKQVMQGMEAFYRQANLQKLIDRLNASQTRDDLTGVYNYNGFTHKCRDICEDALMNGKRILLFAIDMKGLGQVNTRLGRKTGDDAIQVLADIIMSSISKSDVCMRMCNDEFVVASRMEEENENYARDVIERIEAGTRRFNEVNKDDYKIEICYAVDREMITGAEDLDKYINDLINNKNNMKMKEYIESSRNPELTEADLERDRMVAEILDNNRLAYYFQPIVNARTGQIYAYEVLMRTSSDEYVSPLDIIESAERMGRLSDVERATFVNVLSLVEEKKDELEGKKIFLNSIPGCRLSDNDQELIEELLRKLGDKIVVEFTEEAELSDQMLGEIKEKYLRMNVETAIDDYGSGYSNVNNLLRYMPRYVKIDRMLMTNIHEDPQKQHFVKDIIEFAHDNDIVTLAEGVELNKELREVIRLGADLIQGYYTAKPSSQAIQEIDKKVVMEIVQYNQTETTKYGKKTYVITDEDDISMVQLAFNKYTALDFRKIGEEYRHINMTGTPGFKSNILMNIGDGFRGELRIDSISLGGEKGTPCIKLGNNCDVRIVLTGDNELRTGGIQVPESSRLEIAGDGDLRITQAGGKYYCIGNDLSSRHGDLYFSQDGTLSITATGMRGIGIGSGLGGNIYIKQGRFEIDQRGQEGVVIGCMDSDCELRIENCDIEIYNGIARGVSIGSYNGNADIQIENISGKISGASISTAVVGTLGGSKCRVRMQNINVVMNVRSNECYGIGCRNGDTDIEIKYAYVKVVAQGRNAYAMGNGKHTAKILFVNSDINTQVTNSVGMDIGADEKDITIGNGRVSFLINGMARDREVQTVDL